MTTAAALPCGRADKKTTAALFREYKPKRDTESAAAVKKQTEPGEAGSV